MTPRNASESPRTVLTRCSSTNGGSPRTRHCDDAIRLLLLRVADEKRLPFTVRVPNATTVKAIKELDEGKGKRFDTAEELFEDLGV